jgi:2'-5' RNA ligase
LTTDAGDAIRLFTAIDLPEEVKQSLVRLCHGIPGVRWVKPEQLHLTLRFIGSVNQECFAGIREMLSGIGAPPVTLTLNRVGAFPATGPPRVLWAGIERSGELASLRDQVEKVLVAAGCEAETRLFSPHITLARLKDVPRSLILPYLTQHASFSEGPFEVNEFRLYSSMLSRQGSSHRVEKSYPLLAGIAPGGGRQSGIPELSPCS